MSHKQIEAKIFKINVNEMNKKTINLNTQNFGFNSLTIFFINNEIFTGKKARCVFDWGR